MLLALGHPLAAIIVDNHPTDIDWTGYRPGNVLYGDAHVDMPPEFENLVSGPWSFQY